MGTDFPFTFTIYARVDDWSARTPHELTGWWEMKDAAPDGACLMGVAVSTNMPVLRTSPDFVA